MTDVIESRLDHRQARSRRPQLQFDRIQQLRAHEYVAEQIRRHIALRLIGHGDLLPPERELAAMFGVGRPTIQLALRVLEADGLVEARRGRRGGTFVLQPAWDARSMDDLVARLLPQRDELEELLVYRSTIEPIVGRLAAETRSKRDLGVMRVAIDVMRASASEPEYMRHDTEFHVVVARATHNRYLIRAIEQIRIELNDALSLLPESETWHRRLEDEHEAIFDAIVAGDTDTAQAAVDLHVAESCRGVRAVLASAGRRSRR